jgi:hypothetical protein
MSENENTYEIFADRFADVQAAIAKVNKRAEKLGVPSIELSVVGEYVKEINKESYRKYIISISTDTIKLDGWQFLATLQHTSEGNIVRTVPGSEVDTTEYRETDAYCAHCNTVRNRIDTYIVKHEDGTLKQVGSSCIKDFLGHDPKGAIWMASFLAELDGFMGEYDEVERGSSTKPVYKIEDYLAWVTKTIRENGWLSRSKARYEDGGLATADLAEELRYQFYRKMKGEAPTAKDEETAEKALAWARSIDRSTESDYLYNLLIASSPNYITHREFGLVASAVAAYQREVEKEIKAKHEASVSGYQGEVGKRQVFENLTVERVIYNEGAYGVTYITKLVDDKGNIYTWFASKELEQGQTYNLKATVKKHEEYRGVKQTVITRGKVE